MRRIFKILRKLSVEKGKLQNYLKYALGEILLIVIGILIGLSLNNKSIEFEKKKTFDIALGHLYTNLYCEYGWYEYVSKGLEKQKDIAIRELNGIDTLSGSEIPYRIAYLNSRFPDYNTTSQHILNQLQENITSRDDNVLVNQINAYYAVLGNWVVERKSLQIKSFERLLEKYNMPYEGRQDIYNDKAELTVLEFTKEDIAKADSIRKDKAYKDLLRSMINRTKELIFEIDYQLNETKAILEYCDTKKYNLLLTFNNVGIIGTALPDRWEKSVPMQLIDKEKSVWVIRTELQDGEIKFRNGNGWTQNWGATYLLNGDILFFGTNIPVKKGYYEIELNITDKRYSIKKIDKPV